MINESTCNINSNVSLLKYLVVIENSLVNRQAFIETLERDKRSLLLKIEEMGQIRTEQKQIRLNKRHHSKLTNMPFNSEVCPKKRKLYHCLRKTEKIVVVDDAISVPLMMEGKDDEYVDANMDMNRNVMDAKMSVSKNTEINPVLNVNEEYKENVDGNKIQHQPKEQKQSDYNMDQITSSMNSIIIYHGSDEFAM